MPRTPLAPVLAPTVGSHGYGGQIDTPAKGADLCGSLGDRAAVLLPGHGCVVVGSGVEEVSARAVALEDCCRVELAAAQIGAPWTPAEPVSTAGSSEVTFILWHDLVRGLDIDGE